MGLKSLYNEGDLPIVVGYIALRKLVVLVGNGLDGMSSGLGFPRLGFLGRTPSRYYEKTAGILT